MDGWFGGGCIYGERVEVEWREQREQGKGSSKLCGVGDWVSEEGKKRIDRGRERDGRRG